MRFLSECVRRSPRSLAACAASALLIAFATVALYAQESETQPDRDHAPFVLHVYANLIQFPTIVLGTNLKPILPVPRQKFAVTIDGGPVFHPTQMRLEGNDPIALGVLLDVSGAQDKLIADFATAFSQLAPAFLHPNDRVAIYAQDCRLSRSLHDLEPDRDHLRSAIEQAITANKLHGDKPHTTCKDSLRLWDTLSLLTQNLSQQPGRRVILAVTLGEESKSQTSFADLRSFVGSTGTAVFRLRDVALIPDSSTQRSAAARYALGQNFRAEDLFGQLCALSGGMTLDVSRRDLVKQFQDFITLLRGRYILEFPRPDDSTPILHRIDVTIPGTIAFIRSTGGSSPLPDPALLNDPNTLRSSPSPAVAGKRHALESNPKP